MENTQEMKPANLKRLFGVAFQDEMLNTMVHIVSKARRGELSPDSTEEVQALVKEAGGRAVARAKAEVLKRLMKDAESVSDEVIEEHMEKILRGVKAETQNK